MSSQMETFEGYWSSLDEEVAELGDSKAEIADLPIRSTEFSTAYGVTLETTSGFRVFGYYSVPNGTGPFPGLFMTPGYGSVSAVPAYERRRRYAVFSLSARGQRLSNANYAAAYPGLLTDRIDEALEYPFRGIVADCLTAADFLLSRPEVDRNRVGASGMSAGDLALITAALRPQIGALLIGSPLLFRDTLSRLPDIEDYPLEEINDFLRAHPEKREAVERTVSLFDPLRFASRVKGKALFSCSEPDRAHIEPLVDALDGQGQIRIKTGRGFIDHEAEEAWLQSATAG